MLEIRGSQNLAPCQTYKNPRYDTRAHYIQTCARQDTEEKDWRLKVYTWGCPTPHGRREAFPRLELISHSIPESSGEHA